MSMGNLFCKLKDLQNKNENDLQIKGTEE